MNYPCGKVPIFLLLEPKMQTKNNTSTNRVHLMVMGHVSFLKQIIENGNHFHGIYVNLDEWANSTTVCYYMPYGKEKATHIKHDKGYIHGN